MKINWFKITSKNIQMYVFSLFIELNNEKIYTDDNDYYILEQFNRFLNLIKQGTFCKDCSNLYMYCTCNYIYRYKKEIKQIINNFILHNYSKKLIENLKNSILKQNFPLSRENELINLLKNKIDY